MRTLLAFLVCLAAAVPLSGQVTFDAQSSVGDLLTSGAPTTTLAHITGPGNNRLLLVSVHLGIRDATGAAVSGVTYGGQALTRSAAINDGSSDTRTEVWYLLNPPSGANNVVVTTGGLGGADVGARVGATTFSGANQAAPSAGAFEDHSSTPAVTVAGTATNDLVVDFLTTREDTTATPSAAQTAGYNAVSGSGNEHVRAANSRRAGAAGATSMTWTLSKNRRWTQIGVGIQAARADIGVTKTVSDPGPDGTFAQGETLTWTIGVTNNGPSRATNIVVTDTLPSGFSVTSINPGSPTCTQSGSTVTCNYAAMNPGTSNSITITGTITTSQTMLVNTASATRDEIDPNSANDSASAQAAVVAPTVVHMFEMEAVQDAKGKVQITWTTSFEADNLGFNVYRETSAGREQLNKHLIAGSALFTRRGDLDSGRSYRWNDKLKDGAFAQYWIEDVDLNGTRTMHGPVAPSPIGEIADAPNTDTIADLGSAGGVFVSPRGIGAASHPRTRGSIEQQWDLASQAAVKLMITAEGWYRVPFADLTAAGFTPGKRLALFTDGIEQPIRVDHDAIEFYGVGIDTPHAGARAYWLVNEKGTSARIKKQKADKNAIAATNTPFTVERIERSNYVASLLNASESGFYGPVIGPVAVTQGLTIENLDRGGDAATLEAVLQGGTDQTHVVQIAVNGQPVTTAQFAKTNRKTVTVSVPLALLVDGANTIGFVAQNGPLDFSVLESVRLTYPHVLVANDDALKVTVSGGATVSVRGFTSASVRGIDVTNPAEPIELDADLASGTATVVAPSGGTRTILLAGASRIAAPAQIVASRPSLLNATTNAADLVILAPRSFLSAAEPLKARRDAEGIATVIVDVQDVYDEFGFGHRGPEAIREFLRRTQAWQRAPRYALLLGDASNDPRNYLGFGTFDFVPTKLIDTLQLKTASDDWLADFTNSGVPQVAIGRLPARTLAEAETMVAKIVSREVAANAAVKFVADPARGFDFNAAATSLASLVPAPAAIARSATSASFDSLLLTYLGHGSTDIWSAGRFRGTHAANLRNTTLPIVAAMTCLNGYYHDAVSPSFAEGLMRNPNGGAVAVWASSSLTDPRPQIEMTRELLRSLFAGATLGEAVLAAKAATADGDTRRSWILFGDPSLRLR